MFIDKAKEKFKNKKIITVLCILFIIFLLLLFMTIRNYMGNLLFSTEKFNHLNFEFESTQYISFENDKDLVYLVQPCCDNYAEFRLRNKNIALLKIKFDGLYETLKYKVIDDYIIFWVNGEPDKFSQNHAKRNNVLSRIFKYNIKTSKIEELSFEDNDKIIIIDIIKDADEYIILGEKALKMDSWGRWKESKIFINEIEYDISISYESEFNGSFIKQDDNFVVTTDNGIYLFNDSMKLVYDYTDTKYAKLLEYKDYVIGFIDDKIYKFDKKFNIIEQCDFSYTGYYDFYITDGGVFMYYKYDDSISYYYLNFDNFNLALNE